MKHVNVGPSLQRVFTFSHINIFIRRLPKAQNPFLALGRL